MTCPGAVHKTHRTVCLLIQKEETMQGAFIAILTFSLGTGKLKRDRKAMRSSVLMCVGRDLPVLMMFFISTAPYSFSFGTTLSHRLRSYLILS